MKKMLFVLSVALLVLSSPIISSGALMLCSPRSKCQKASELRQEQVVAQQKAEKARQLQIELEQREKIAQQKESERLAQEKIAEQEQAEKIRKENEYQLKIKELETRLNKLETQQSISEAEITLKKIQADLVILNKNKNRQISKKPEPKNIEVSHIIPKEKIAIVSSSSATSTIVVPQPRQEKSGWFKRLLNLFNRPMK